MGANGQNDVKIKRQIEFEFFENFNVERLRRLGVA